MLPGEVSRGHVDQRGDPVAATEQGNQVQREPDEPGESAAHAHAVRQFDHRGAVPDRGHDALVAVAERDRRLAALKPANLIRSVLAHLQGRLGELRQWLTVDERDVTDREDPLVPGDTKIRTDADAATVRLRQAPPA